MTLSLRTGSSACGVDSDAPGPRAGDVLPVEEILKSGWGAGLSSWRRREVGVDAFEVDRDGRQDMLDVGLVFASVAALAHAVAIDELADRALDGGPQRVARQPFLGLLLGPRLGLDVVEIARQEGDFPGVGADERCVRSTVTRTRVGRSRVPNPRANTLNRENESPTRCARRDRQHQISRSPTALGTQFDAELFDVIGLAQQGEPVSLRRVMESLPHAGGGTLLRPARQVAPCSPAGGRLVWCGLWPTPWDGRTTVAVDGTGAGMVRCARTGSGRRRRTHCPCPPEGPCTARPARRRGRRGPRRWRACRRWRRHTRTGR